MQTNSHSGAVTNSSESGNAGGLNGRHSFTSNNGPRSTHATPDNFIFEQVDPSHLGDGDDDSDSDLTTHFSSDSQGQPTHSTGLKPGKKTKGRVKIKMEFIENKLRRYTTFSKRKTGIMKKAYELSTLTGTQVMLLVASETGHVYTFATRKLQPMITSDSGKALIQTCLNSPDPAPGSSGHSVLEQRMNPSGFEETELSYSVGDEDSKVIGIDAVITKPVYQMSSMSQSSIDTHTLTTTAANSPTQVNTTTLAPHMSFTSQPITVTTPTIAVSSGDSASGKVTGIPLNIPGLILHSGSGQSLAFQTGQLSVSGSGGQPQTLYRTVPGQIVTTVTNANHVSSSGETTSVATPSTLSFLSGTSGMTPGQIIMYQTPQGVVYAAPTPTATMGDRTIFNFPQPATAISIPQSENVGGGQQIITIPIPVSLASSPQVLQLSSASTGETILQEVPAHVTPAKKSRK